MNATRDELTIPLEVTGAVLDGSGERYEIAGDDPMAFNDPDQAEPAVRVVRSPVADVSDHLRVAPCSVTLFVLRAAPATSR